MKGEVGVKDIYEKMIRLETLIEAQDKNSGETIKHFKSFAILLVLIGILNIVVHILI